MQGRSTSRSGLGGSVGGQLGVGSAVHTYPLFFPPSFFV